VGLVAVNAVGVAGRIDPRFVANGERHLTLNHNAPLRTVTVQRDLCFLRKMKKDLQAIRAA